jgi:hypothetical protein
MLFTHKDRIKANKRRELITLITKVKRVSNKDIIRSKNEPFGYNQVIKRGLRNYIVSSGADFPRRR